MKRVFRNDSIPARFNMTPMIDVIFLLIIFFLCVNQFQRVETDEAVRLPKASRANVQDANRVSPKRLIFNVKQGEGVTVGGRNLPIAKLPAFLADQGLQSGSAQLEVWIRSDRGVPYGDVEPILLACADVGVWNVSFKVVTNDANR